MLALFLFFCGIVMRVCAYAEDTITPDQALVDGETVVSPAGVYELGFFTPGSTPENLRYLGIWYKKISQGTVVWVANRDFPVKDKSGRLILNGNGSLVLVDGNNRTVWSANSSSVLKNAVARLSDGGNLVVMDGDGDGGSFGWQSFDYPSDTLLPGMKLGKNLVTGKEWFISSWKSPEDPSTGDYVNRLNSDGYTQAFVMKGSEIEFSTGPWNGRSFTSSVASRPNTYYTYQLISTSDEIYFTYDLIKNMSVLTRLVILPNGQVQHLTWIERTQNWIVYLNVQVDNCDRYSLCGPYAACNIDNSPPCGCLEGFRPKFAKQWKEADWSGGCVRNNPVGCGKGDGFRTLSGIKMPDSRKTWYSTTMNLKECEKMCLQNCSCTAYTVLDVRDGSGCLMYIDELIDMRELSQNDQPLYVRMAASDIAADKRQKKQRVKAISIALSAVIGFILLCFLVWCGLYRRRSKRDLYDDEEMECPMFDLATVSAATHNFSNNNMIGEGGFGAVYKGKLAEGKEIAVKRLSRQSLQGKQELQNEMALISKLQHRNLVKLLGCCLEGEEKMLIYEFMPNNSLDHFIFDPQRRGVLTWQRRFDIAMGISRGLLYLHQDSRLRIVHRDLKASNILLDNNFHPKISDFGLAKIMDLDQTEGKTRLVIGTYGYMSPEYAVDGKFSVKSDVFSLGVLILELVSGKKNRTFRHSDHLHNLLGHAWILWKEGRAVELIDENLEESSYVESEVVRCIQVGLLCVQKAPDDRPTAASVVSMMGNKDVRLPQPKQPGFFVERSSNSTGSTVVSENELSLTIMEAR
ncbi:PREDICTED: G-type lectin S-receptor-like serine/threonine-protein kinase At4g27290 [Ipomoea nil]|uniref:G-type lectin S-receptor-like serine/threonine-protein kinase At4g27290 n=1 Tax=Ipomoea nil TaxID=35883 RepID=UPI0009009309|nr:PREDICTED: G-type lectin S-receptor-like serine/threonine-protein kinase At4g27290 [Ipomoea nil]